MRRRDFAKVFAIVCGSMFAVPRLSFAKKIEVKNNFMQGDTLSERILKFNTQTGMSLVLMYRHTSTWKDFGLDFAKNDPQRGDTINITGSRVYQDQETGFRFWLEEDGERFTGEMTAYEMFHWTAQVALGYRIARNR